MDTISSELKLQEHQSKNEPKTICENHFMSNTYMYSFSWQTLLSKATYKWGNLRFSIFSKDTSLHRSQESNCHPCVQWTTYSTTLTTATLLLHCSQAFTTRNSCHKRTFPWSDYYYQLKYKTALPDVVTGTKHISRCSDFPLSLVLKRVHSWVSKYHLRGKVLELEKRVYPLGTIHCLSNHPSSISLIH